MIAFDVAVIEFEEPTTKFSSRFLLGSYHVVKEILGPIKKMFSQNLQCNINKIIGFVVDGISSKSCDSEMFALVRCCIVS